MNIHVRRDLLAGSRSLTTYPNILCGIWASIPTRISYMISSLVWMCLSCLAPSYLNELCRPLSSCAGCYCIQRHQSAGHGLKSGVLDPGKKIDFPGKFLQKIQFFQVISKKFQFCRQKFRNYFFYFKISAYSDKIGHLQLLLGKLFYFSTKVNTYTIPTVHGKILGLLRHDPSTTSDDPLRPLRN